MTSDELAADAADGQHDPDENDMPLGSEQDESEQDDTWGTEASLSPKISLKLALGAPHLALCLALALVYLLANYLPLRGADLWLHVLYGQWILDHGALPTAEPFMPFSQGMRLVDSQWLSQILFAGIQRAAGAEMLSTLFAALMVAAQTALARAIYVRSGSIAAAASGVFLFVLVGWSRLGAIRPEILALFCFALLLWILAEGFSREEQEARFGWTCWIAAPILFAAWANLHGSFVCGLVALGCIALGEVVESLWRHGGVAGMMSDGRVRRRVFLAELCFAATLLNPYGLDLILYALMFSGNENLNEVLEWQPMVILGPGGRSFAFAIVLLMLLMRHSRQPVSFADGLLLLVFGIATVMGIRMMTWFAPLFAFLAAPHLLDVADRLWPRAEESGETEPDSTETDSAEPDSTEPGPAKPPPGRSFHYSLACVVVLWVAFAISPSATPLLGGADRTPIQLFGDDTPVGLSEHLRENPPSGPLLCPQQWSDWLIFDGPENVKPFVTSNIHMTPRQVWVDYLAMNSNRASWDGMLERYRIGSVALDKTRHQNQIRVMRRKTDWRQTYEDQRVIFFRLRQPAKQNEPTRLAER